MADGGRGLALAEETSMKNMYLALFLCVCVHVRACVCDAFDVSPRQISLLLKQLDASIFQLFLSVSCICFILSQLQVT